MSACPNCDKKDALLALTTARGDDECWWCKYCGALKVMWVPDPVSAPGGATAQSVKVYVPKRSEWLKKKGL